MRRCPKELLNIIPGNRKEKKCHTTHRCDTQDGQECKLAWHCAQPSTPVAGDCNLRKASTRAMLFYKLLKQDPVVRSPRHLPSFIRDNIV